jgi:hypothetical protein
MIAQVVPMSTGMLLGLEGRTAEIIESTSGREGSDLGSMLLRR